MTSKTHSLKNAMRVYATELICNTGVSGFQTFKLVLILHNIISCVYTLKFHASE